MSENPFWKYSLVGLRTQSDWLRAASPDRKSHKEMMISAADTIEQLTRERDEANELLDMVYDDICTRFDCMVRMKTARLLTKREAVKHAAKVAKHSGEEK